MTAIASPLDRKTRAGWLLVAFALGGFFDGIVLHQVLQWHHLLSGLDERGGDLRFQIMADGLFHALMYVLAVVGAILLVSSRAADARPGTTSEILRLALLGFGIWHIVDAVLFHRVLGLHRIKMDSDMPLVWDVAWLIVFGLVPVVLALVLPSRGGDARGAASAVMSVTVLAGLVAGAGPRFSGSSETIIVFRAGMTQSAMMQAVQAAEASIKWTDADGSIWAVDPVSWSGLVTLHAQGAIIVSDSPVLAGCLAWSRAPEGSRSGPQDI